MTLEFDETGGYDCMTGAWLIRDDDHNIIVRIDQANFGQDHCDYEFRSDKAKAIAETVYAALVLTEGK